MILYYVNRYVRRLCPSLPLDKIGFLSYIMRMSKNKNNNGWTEERRRKQAEAIRRWKPWEKSTGPKTPEGKKRTRLNALKNGSRARVFALYAKLCRTNRDFIKLCFMTEYMPCNLEEVTNRLIENEAKSNACEKSSESEQSD